MAVHQILSVLVLAVITYQVLYFFEESAFKGNTLQGKNVLVIGASSGIGEEMAYWYTRFGANVFITARREHKLKQVAAHCETLAPPGSFRVSYVAADMANEEDRNHVMQRAMKFFDGDIDQLILNHAYFPPVYIWNGSDVQLAHLKGMLNVNVVSFVHMTALALPSLKRSNGSVAAVSSVAGRFPSPLFLEYAASKFGLDGFFSSLRFEFKATRQNVSITYITIGAVGTEHGVSTLDKVYSKLSSASEFFKYIFTPARPEDAAYAIIEATTLRKGDVIYPTNQLIWLQTVLRMMFPEFLENTGLEINS